MVTDLVEMVDSSETGWGELGNVFQKLEEFYKELVGHSPAELGAHLQWSGSLVDVATWC
jgi:hypothetical protein